MKLTLAIDFADRTVLMKELHSLVAGDLYDPLVLDFSSAPPSAFARMDDSSLRMTLRRDGPAGVEIASVPMFSRVPGHRFLRASTLSFATSALSDWWSEVRAGADPRARAACWLEVSDSLFTYVACEIPVVLRDFTVRDGQDVAGYYTAAYIDSLVASLRLTFDDSPAMGSVNPVKSGGIAAALAGKADAATVAAALAGKADTATVTAALAGKADTATVTAALAGKADAATVAAALAGKADAATVAAAIAGKADADTVAAAAETAAAAAVSAAGLVTQQTLSASLSDRITRSELETALQSKASTTDIPDVSGLVTAGQLAAALAAKADADDIPDVSGLATTAQLAAKADSSSVYTKAEVDELVGSAGGSPAAGQVPLRAETDHPVYVQQNGVQTQIASVRSVERDSDGVLAVELSLAPVSPLGLREAFPGTIRLARSESFSAEGVSSDSAQASVSWAHDELVFALGDGSWTAPFAPAADFGGPRVSEVVDEAPAERPDGAAPRLVTSAGVKSALDGKVDLSTYSGDLVDTRLVTAQNATTAARATAAAARNLSLILDLEARFDGVDPEEVG